MWDFSSEGWKAGAQQFFWSALKTALAAGLGALATYLLSKLNYFEAHLSIMDHYYAYEAGFLVIARAAISGGLEWVTTYTTGSPIATEPSPSGL